MKTTIFFDLDGTLLPMDFNQFMKKYFAGLAKHFYDLMDPTTLQKAVMGGTEAMVKDHSERTNEDVFMTYFRQFIDGDIGPYQERFNTFYVSEQFKAVKEATTQSAVMQEAINILKDKGYEIVIATNPLFPMQANLERIEWAGLNKDDFTLITSLEGNTKCKPSPLFYQELLDTLSLEASDVLMVGNDYVEDLAASECGIETYIVKGCTLNDDIKQYQADFDTSDKDFLTYVKALPKITQ
ncbi:MAG: HAD family hydrolase [Candidatus Izemoplasma sp.]|nr:HAD family hydrolase [Candidatus Izemoplasma sp.]